MRNRMLIKLGTMTCTTTTRVLSTGIKRASVDSRVIIGINGRSKELWSVAQFNVDHHDPCVDLNKRQLVT